MKCTRRNYIFCHYRCFRGRKWKHYNQVVNELVKNKLEIELKDEDIDRTHRTGCSSDCKPRAIKVKLARYDMRKKLYEEQKNAQRCQNWQK